MLLNLHFLPCCCIIYYGDKMSNKRVIKVLENQGFCYGVNHSIEIVEKVLKDNNNPRPIYLLNSIVHNKYVNEYFKEKGIIVLEGKSKLDLLDEIKFGTVIFSAHGVSDLVKEKAKSMNINVVDATCPFVEKSYQLIKKYINDDYHILYFGKNNHPESEAVLSFSDNVTLITDLNVPNINHNKIAIGHQTTMSSYDVESIYDQAIKQNNNIVKLPMICNATNKRQEELKSALEEADLTNTLVIIVGDKTSNNCTKLYELAKRYTDNSLFISTWKELLSLDLSKYNNCIISSGTSTPLINVKQVTNYIKSLKKQKDINDLKKYIKKIL